MWSVRFASRAAGEWSRALDPTMVVSEDADSIRLRIPADRSGASIKIEIEWEGGEIEHRWFWLPELRQLDRAVVDGREFVAKRIPLPPLRLGYHRIRALWMREPELERFAEARFIVCPRETRQPEGRIAGVAVSLYGLRSQRNWGCGDFTDLRALIETLAPAGVDFIALNPLHAIPNRQPYNTSPYLPQCSLYRNFIYLDVERVAEGLFADSIEIADATALAGEAETLRASEFVEYERVASLKSRVLRVLFRRFREAGGSPDLDALRRIRGRSAPRFRGLLCPGSSHAPAQSGNVAMARLAGGISRPALVRRGAIRCGTFARCSVFQVLTVANRSPARRSAGACDRARHADRVVSRPGAGHRPLGSGSVGQPPVLRGRVPGGSSSRRFLAERPGLGVSPPNREVHRADGYELFAKLIRKTARHGGALRIDHVMRFFRLWWIPDGMTATDGAYVRDYAADLLGILKLESRRGGFIVIGEDSGDRDRRSAGRAHRIRHPELPRVVVRAAHGWHIQNAG